MIGLLIDLIILCIVGGIFWYILNLLPIPAPFKNIAIALFLLIVLLVAVSFLLPMTGMHGVWLR